MAYKWPDKDKDEIVDYSIDWSRFLGSDSVSGAVWYIHDADDVKVEALNSTIVNGLQFVSSTNTTTTTTARFSLGTNNVRYTITCSIRTTQGLQYERSIFLRVKEK